MTEQSKLEMWMNDHLIASKTVAKELGICVQSVYRHRINGITNKYTASAYAYVLQCDRKNIMETKKYAYKDPINKCKAPQKLNP